MKNKITKKPKYFTPKLESLKVGYECEFLTYDKPITQVEVNEQKEWIPVIIDLDFFSPVNFNENSIADEEIRVRFLDKKQIKNEGWIPKTEPGLFTKGKYELYYNQLWNNDKEFSLQILEQPNFIFNGFCKDINTFREIINLLEI